MSGNKEQTQSSSAAGISLAGGIIITIAGFVSSFWHFTFIPQMTGMMGSNPITGGSTFVNLIGIVFGILVIIGASLMYKTPSQTKQWGIIVLVFSVLSFFGMGGFFIGALLGIIGGIIAITKN